MARRFLVLMLFLAALAPHARAQETPTLGFIKQMVALIEQERIDDLIALIEQNRELAGQTFQQLAMAYSSMNQEQQAFSAALANIIARVFDIRLNDPSLSQYLAKFDLLFGDEHWQGTPLARGAPGSTHTGGPPSTGPTGGPPVATGDSEVLIIFLLRSGNYPDAVALLQKLATRNPSPEAVHRHMRYGIAAMIGMGVPNQALPAAEELIGFGSSDPTSQLAAELLAARAAFGAGLPLKARPHIQAAKALVPNVSGTYGQVARFLIDSWNFSLELQQNPKMPFEVLKQRHDQAWANLSNLQDSPHLTTELFWVGEAFWEVWLLQLAARDSSDPRIQQIIKNDLQVLYRLPESLTSHPEARLAVVRVLLRLVSAYQESGGEMLAQARKELVEIEGHLVKFHSATQQEYEQLKNIYAGLLQETGVQLSADHGDSNALLAGMYLLQAEQILAENEEGSLSSTDAAVVKEKLTKATDSAMGASSFELIQYITVAQLDYFDKARPANWEKSSEELINNFLNEPAVNEMRGVKAGMYYRRGKLRSAQGRNAEAVADYQRAIDVVEEYIRDIGGGAESGDYIRLFASDLYEDMAKAQLEQGKGSDAFGTIGRLQQLETAGTFSMDDLRGKMRSEDQGLVTRATEQKMAIQAQEKELATLKSSNASTDQIQKVSQLLAQSRQSYYQTVTDLEKKYPAFQKLDIKPINFSKLQRAIPANTLVVLLFPTEDELYLLEATKDNLMVRKVAVKKSELEQLTATFRSQVTAYSRNPGAFSWKGPEAAVLKQSLGGLYESIVKPIEPDLAGKEAVAFVPYGSLVYLPFQALLSEGPNGTPTFLVEKMQVVVLSKAADLDQIFGPPSDKNGSLVAFGNPDGSLAAATQEVKALADIFPGSAIYVEGQATSDKLNGVQAPRVSYLHLATHGNLNPQDPRASYLTLAKGGKLSVTDITNSRLDSEGGDLNLVTLSACQTALAGRGGSQDGSDLRSLADAFSFAGCRSMVASLWKVEDNSTRDLMVVFYQNLKAGKSKAASLQAAQLSLLKQERYSHPFYWAPFILIGDWR